MDIGLFVAAGFGLAGVATFAQLVWGWSRLPELRRVLPLAAGDPAPCVSIVVAAKDEELHAEEAVRALLGLDYPDYELIVVDDRSTDRTPAILAALAKSEPRLQVVTVADLPAGWLGKNHALHVGAARARGELLLFTDGDVVFERLALSRAVRLFHAENADHVTVSPKMMLPSAALELVVSYGFMWGFLALRPWKTRDPESSASVGIGAFNLVRAESYREVGGHTRIPLRPDDDLMLGKLIKQAGFRQIVATGIGEISVEWYRTLGEAARGFRKNTFAALRYSAILAAAGVVLNVVGAWPFAAVFLTHGPTRDWYVVAALAWVGALAYLATRNRAKPWLAPLYPLAALATAWLIADVVTRNLLTGAIEWRGTYYPLDDLRKNTL